MDNFEKKAISTALEKEFDNIFMEFYDSGNENHANVAKVKIQYGGLEIYTGIYYWPNEKELLQRIGKKIKYAKIAAKCAKDGLNNHEIILESLRWINKGREEKDSLKNYAKAIQRAAGGTWEALVAIRALSEGKERYEIENKEYYCDNDNILEESLRQDLENINFYKEIEKQKRKLKFKRYIDSLMPGKRRMVDRSKFRL